MVYIHGRQFSTRLCPSFINVRFHYVVDTLEGRFSRDMAGQVAACRQFMCWVKYEVFLRRDETGLFLENFYNLFLVVDRKSVDRSNGLLQSIILVSISYQDFLFIALRVCLESVACLSYF